MTGWLIIYINFGWDATHVNCRSNLWCNPSLQLRCSRRFSSSLADSVWSARRGHTMRRPMADWEGGNCRELTCKYLLDLWTSNCRKQWVTRSKSSSFFCLIVVRSVLFIYVCYLNLCSHEFIHRSVAMNLSPMLPNWNSHRSKKCIVFPVPLSTLQNWFASHPWNTILDHYYQLFPLHCLFGSPEPIFCVLSTILLFTFWQARPRTCSRRVALNTFPSKPGFQRYTSDVIIRPQR